jgi:glucokinase
MVLAIDIGGTKLAVGATTRDELARTGRLATLLKEPIPAPGDPATVIARVIELARSIAPSEGFEAIGVSIGGPLDHESGMVVNFPHLPGWKEIALCDELARALGAPARLDNDANLGALAEHRLGAGRAVRDMVYMTISTGIGGGLIVDDRLVHGVGSAAAEMGHITVQTDGPLCDCGNPGCLERMASGTNIARAARERMTERPEHASRLLTLCSGDPRSITAEHVARAAAEGDLLALEVWERAVEYLAIGIGSILHVLAPPLVVLGGGVAQAGETLLVPLRRHLRRHVFYVPLDRIAIVTASLGHDSAVLGAAVLATGIER